MMLFLRDQRHQMAAHLHHFKKVPVMPYDAAGLRFRTDEIRLHAGSSSLVTHEQVLFDYRIFPEHIMTSFGQWQEERRVMQAGDTIVQQVQLPPFKHVSIKLVLGVRVKAIFREEKGFGFSYETLEGHVERGISTFMIERRSDDAVFRITTRSGPGHWTSRAAGPFLARPYQRYATLQALAHVARQFSAPGGIGG